MQSIKFNKSNDQDDVGRMIGLAFAGFFAAIFIGLFFGFPLMWLWNAIMPKVFGLATITFWQTVGLFILAKFFFGFGGGGGKHGGRTHTSKDHKWKRWGHAKSPDDSALADDDSLQQYWQQEGKAAYEAFLAARQANKKSTPDDSGAPT